jgi:hypothetical protein
VTLKFTNVAKFNREMDRFAKTVMPRELVLFQKKIALDALARIIMRTAVDSGHARGNWQVTIDVSTEEELDVLDKNGAATLAAGVAELEALGFGSVVFLTNNTPYILALEHGHSKQHAEGMVEVTFAELLAVFDTQPAGVSAGGGGTGRDAQGRFTSGGA